MRTLACAVVFALAGVLSCSPKAEPRRYNLLLVTIDTLRADHLSCYGYPRETSPNIAALAAQGLVFEKTSTPRAKTSPALASLFSGMYPHEHGVRELLHPIDASKPLLAEAFRRAGYQTAAIVGNFVLCDRYCGFARGFEHYIESLPARLGVPPNDAPQRTAHSLTNAALVALGFEAAPALDENGANFEPSQALLDPTRPWFAWLHYMDPHGTYEAPPDQRVFHSETPRWIDPALSVWPPPSSGKPRSVRVAAYNVPANARDSRGHFDASAVIDLYDAEIRFADSELGRLLERLRARGDLANTWVVVTSDHGESLGEQDDWFEHGFYAYESTCRVPLIVRPPDALANRPLPGRRAGALSLVDLGPALASWLELPPSAPAASKQFGSAVSRAGLLQRDDNAPFATYSEKIEGAELNGSVQIKALRWGRYKLLRRWAHAPAIAVGAPARLVLLGEELYDLELDPLEARDLAASPPAQVPLELMRTKLLEFSAADAPLEELEQRLLRRKAALEASDTEALRELRALGY